MALAAASFAVLAALPAARAWGESGAYELITPPPPNSGAPLSTLWHHAAACSGALFTAGTDAATGRQTVFGLDTADFTWTRYRDLPGDFFAPTIFCSGGLLLAVPPATVDAVLAGLHDGGDHAAAVIGQFAAPTHEHEPGTVTASATTI